MSLLKIKFRFEYLLVFLVLITAIYAAFSPPTSLMSWYSSDDAFYYFQTARNIGDGHGITFDRLGRDSGFHPLWMLVCIPIFTLARFDLILPLRILVLVSGLINAASVVLLYRLLVRHLSKESAALAGLLWITLPHIQSVTAQMGMESTINALCVLWLLFLLASSSDDAPSGDLKPRQVLLIGLAGALALLSRLDNLFLVGMAGLWFIFRRSNLRYILPGTTALIIISAVASYFLRLQQGAEYFQYADSVYFLIASALAVKLPLYLLFRQFQSPPALTDLRGRPRLVLREVFYLAAPALLSGGILFGLMLGFQRMGFFSGFPRLAIVYDLLISLGGMLILRVLHLLQTREAFLPIPLNWKKWLSDGLLYAAPILLLFGAYVVFNLAYFGTALPVSGQIKHWWGSLPNPIYGRPAGDLKSFFGFLEEGNGPWSLLLQLVGKPLEAYADSHGLQATDPGLRQAALTVWLILAGLAAGLVASSWRFIKEKAGQVALFPLLAGCLLQVVSYFGTGYINTRPWYWIIEMILIILATGLLAEALFIKIRSFKSHPVVLPVAVALAGLVLFIRYNAEIIQYIPMKVEPGLEDAYRWGARGLEEVTAPGAVIGSTGGGVIAYFIQDRTIVNLDGLMNSSEYFERLREGTAHEYLDRIGLEYVYGSKYMLTNSDPYMGLFGGRLEFLQDIHGSGLYRYLPGK